MPPRPAPDTPFTEEDLARLPQWAQRKVTWLSGQLARALELAGRDTPTKSSGERADADILADRRLVEAQHRRQIDRVQRAVMQAVALEAEEGDGEPFAAAAG